MAASGNVIMFPTKPARRLFALACAAAGYAPPFCSIWVEENVAAPVTARVLSAAIGRLTRKMPALSPEFRVKFPDDAA